MDGVPVITPSVVSLSLDEGRVLGRGKVEKQGGGAVIRLRPATR